MVIAPTQKLEVFKSQWEGVYAPQYCYMCKGQLYHTEQEHALILSQGLREEIAR